MKKKTVAGELFILVLAALSLTEARGLVLSRLPLRLGVRRWGLAETRFFDPIAEFGLEEEEEAAAAAAAAAQSSVRDVLLILPGLDGTGITAFAQFAELARGYELCALAVGLEDRSSFADLVDATTRLVEAKRLSGSAARQRKVFVLGESMGAGVALRVARDLEASGRAPLDGVVLVSPATGWDRTWLGQLQGPLLALPDGAFAAVLALTTFQILDAGQVRTSLARTLSGEWPDLLATPARAAYVRRILATLPARMNLPVATVKHRLREWVDPTIRERAAAAGLRRTPMLVVAGTADLRVPAAEEAIFFLGLLGEDRCMVHLVQGAGHAGVLDERIDLFAVMGRWRARHGVQGGGTDFAPAPAAV